MLQKIFDFVFLKFYGSLKDIFLAANGKIDNYSKKSNKALFFQHKGFCYATSL
jgi:hypothetical protein